ncbi:acyltransferase [uncultured Nonlabens sp.]|uniref:acyltransferase family protein n=1 Tax=uncultured Nonlabens sp. TaxID=859306 RepID=UPI00263401FF|nr:acyltransferase [uncultured Nonlabens sp.]
MKNYKLSSGSSVILDLIRGVSAQVVVLGHGISFFAIFPLLQQPYFPELQSISVLIFFLLSGFLISYSTIRKKTKIKSYNIKYYMADRFSRIFSAFVPSLLFVVLIDFLSQKINPESYSYSSAYNIKTLFGNLLMLQDFPLFFFLPEKFITSFGSARPFWTLAIEWWIYLFFGYLILVIFNNNKSRIKLSNIILLLIVSIVPMFNLIMGRGHGLTIYWIFGLLVYVVSSSNFLDEIKQNFKIFSLFIIVMFALLRAYFQMDAYDPIFAFLLAIALWLIIDIFKGINFSERMINIINFISSYSFTLYLIHYSILDFLHTHFSSFINSYALFVFGFFISNIISIALGRFTEINLTKKVKEYLYKTIQNDET